MELEYPPHFKMNSNKPLWNHQLSFKYIYFLKSNY